MSINILYYKRGKIKMIKELMINKNKKLIMKYKRNTEITSAIRHEIAEYQINKESEEKGRIKTTSQGLLESHIFFSELNKVLDIITSDIKNDLKIVG